MFAVIAQVIGSLGVFPSRAFIPAFVTALALRYGDQVEWLQDTALIRSVSDAPSWLTSDVTLVVLGVLACLEVFATKSPEIRQFLLSVDGYVKPLMAFLTTLGVMTAADIGALDELTNPVDPVKTKGLAELVPAMVVGVGVFVLTGARASVMSSFSDADADDATGMQRIFSWLEDLWAVATPLLLILIPIVMLLLIAAANGVLWLLRRKALAREEASKAPCASCQELVYACAMACPACSTPLAQPRAIGVFGQTLPGPADAASQPYRLVEKRRCPSCATHLTERAVHQACGRCGHHLMADPAFAAGYMLHVDRRLPLVLGICFLLSLVPVLGLIPGVLLYRIRLVAPYKAYLSHTQGFVLRWSLRIAVLVLIAVQWIPAVGGLSIPVMALLAWAGHRTFFRTELAEVAGAS